MADPRCPVAGCFRPRLTDAFCCGPHWLQLPVELREEISCAELLGDEHGKRVKELAALQLLNAAAPPEAKVARA